MSPALLSQWLKQLEAAGVIVRKPHRADPSVMEYQLTAAGHELAPVIEQFGIWGQRWVDTDLSLQNLDVGLLMWDMRRNLRTKPMPTKRSVVQFKYLGLAPPLRSWWLIVEPDADVDLCSVDPGLDVDLHVTTDLDTMTTIWMGLDTVRNSVDAQRMILTGDRKLSGAMQAWLGLSPFARESALLT